MALQTSNLIMTGLGVWKDVPPNAEQPPLADAVHLRWAFARELGVPWYGFHLFRRLHRAGAPAWLSQVTGGLPTGPWPGRTLDTPQGQLSSDTDLVLTDDFPPAGAVEFDLAGRGYLRFTLPPATPARRVEARLGFRLQPGEPPPTRECVTFTGRTPEEGPNPRTEQGVTFEARDFDDQLRPHTSVRAVQSDGTTVTGLGCKFRLRITLPRPATFVEVTLMGAARRDAGDRAPTIEAFNQDGTRADAAAMQDPASRQPETFVLSGSAITRIVIDEHDAADDTDEGRVILNEICHGLATVSEVRLTGMAGSTPVATASIRGYAGRVLSAAVEFDGMSAVELSPAPAALIDLGTVPLGQEATVGWEQMADFTYPLRLPITHPDYPCTPGAAEDFAAARDLARARICYGDPQRFTAPPVRVPAAGTVSVTSGSPIVLGAGTSWTAGLLDTVLQVTGDATVYTIVMVVSPTKLVLSRRYAGATRAGAAYTIARDAFGQLYNYLAMLVEGGRAGGPMASRALPAPVDTAGTVSVTTGSPSVEGGGTAWAAALAGLAFQVQDDGAVYAIARVDSPTRLTLDRGYQGASGPGKLYRIGARLEASAAGAVVPRMPAQSPLDMVVLGTLHPAVAQMVGVYWADGTADRALTYDYLIVADYTGAAGLDPARMLALIQQSGFAGVEGYIVFNQRMAAAPALPSPTGLQVYALPGSSRRTESGAAQDASSNVGLRWDLGRTDLGVLAPGRPIMYHLWRAALGNDATPAAPSRYDLITKDRPLLVAETGVTPARPRDWPPFPLHAVDSALADGWYGYQVSGIDVFGRHTPNSPAGAWREWAPVPEPRPWYYVDPPGDSVVHPVAVRLLVKIPPPAPAGVEASALDPMDPTVVRDAAYTAWWNALTASAWYQALSAEQRRNLIGLRVRWLWTAAQMEQAPRTREFRIYYQPGPLNALLGRTRAVAAASAAESDVTTDIPNTQPSGSYVGASLQVGDDAFAIVASQPGSPLRVRVRNVGSLDDVAPAVDAPCTVAIPPAYTAGTATVASGARTVTGNGTRWTSALTGMVFRVATEQTAYTVAAVDAPTQLTLDRAYEGPTNREAVYGIRHPRFVDYGVAASWQTRYYVVDADQQWTPATDPAGRPLRRYEIFLPVPQDAVHDGVPLMPSRGEPIVYAHVGVSAADDRTYTADDPKWTGRWGGRAGNEGRVGPPAKIFRVLREPPPPPVSPAMPERVVATRADAGGRSFYTYRWQPADGLPAHVLRALDDAVFAADWAQRPRAALDASQVQFFPDAATDPRWDSARRQQVATELNRLNDFGRDAAGAAQASAYYEGLSNDALRVLAGLPGNDAAFAQLTTRPLDPDDPASANRRGPDDPDGFQVGDPGNPLASPALRAFTDTLDGRAADRYLYRAAHVDAVHNRGALGLAGPPVYVPNVVAPEAPMLLEAVGGARVISLRWVASGDGPVDHYRLYRTDALEAAADLRTMTLHTRIARDPLATPRPGEVVPTPVTDAAGAIVARRLQIDDVVPPNVIYHYRLVTVDASENPSEASTIVSGRGYQPPPGPPALAVPAWDAAHEHVTLSWTAADPDLESRVERRAMDQATWKPVSAWLARGVHGYTDGVPDPAARYRYRITVRDVLGQVNSEYQAQLTP